MLEFAFGRLGVKTAHASDWDKRDVGVLIGLGVPRHLALAREAIDSTRACASGSLHSATINAGALKTCCLSAASNLLPSRCRNRSDLGLVTAKFYVCIV